MVSGSVLLNVFNHLNQVISVPMAVGKYKVVLRVFYTVTFFFKVLDGDCLLLVE